MKALFALLLVGAAFGVAAQQNQSLFDFKTAATANPMVLLPIDNTAMLGVEQRLANGLALLLDAGYVFNSQYFDRGVLEGLDGFMLRPGLKYYGKQKREASIQFQVSYKQVNYRLHDWLGKGCVNDIPAYEQRQRFTYRKKTLAFNLLGSWLFRLSDGALLELYTGLGVKLKHQRPTEDGACYRSAERNFVYSPFRERSITPTLPLGIKILVPVN